jgi:hypothetical protein
MPTYRVTILRNNQVKTTVNNMGPLQEDVHIDARDDYTARGLVQAQYGNLYKVVGCFKVSS